VVEKAPILSRGIIIIIKSSFYYYEQKQRAHI